MLYKKWKRRGKIAQNLYKLVYYVREHNCYSGIIIIPTGAEEIYKKRKESLRVLYQSLLNFTTKKASSPSEASKGKKKKKKEQTPYHLQVMYKRYWNP